MEPILPPLLRRPPGRPHKSRRKEEDEVNASRSKITKSGVQMTCRKCGKTGHNVRTCKGKVGANSRRSKLPVRRPSANVPRQSASQPAHSVTIRWMPDGSSQTIRQTEARRVHVEVMQEVKLYSCIYF
ncbi:Retroviral ribonuclease H protein [Dioscorea alata]|uniref:Retroviral ribonuclease H protein n=1 Tax=Dioscorea alata TaxID=55571 RepID=A0ACB7URR6_DIOAL|nr:Retroviral ribonuclease H protein [Dioscorea alata]